MNPIAAQKIISLQRCTSRARGAHQQAGNGFAHNFDLQDAAILNILRACELTLDLANMTIRHRHLGIPVNSRDSFVILQREGIIAPDMGTELQNMIGFRNLAVHQYQEINLAIVERVLDSGLTTLLAFANIAKAVLDEPEV